MFDRDEGKEAGADTEAKPEELGEQNRQREYMWFCNPLTSITTCIQKLASRIGSTQKNPHGEKDFALKLLDVVLLLHFVTNSSSA